MSTGCTIGWRKAVAWITTGWPGSPSPMRIRDPAPPGLLTPGAELVQRTVRLGEIRVHPHQPCALWIKGSPPTLYPAISKRPCRVSSSTGTQRVADRTTSAAISAIRPTSFSVSVGCTSNIRLVSPSCRATSRRCWGRKSVPWNALSR